MLPTIQFNAWLQCQIPEKKTSVKADVDYKYYVYIFYYVHNTLAASTAGFRPTQLAPR